jgi:hypothetical protein
LWHDVFHRFYSPIYLPVLTIVVVGRMDWGRFVVRVNVHTPFVEIIAVLLEEPDVDLPVPAASVVSLLLVRGPTHRGIVRVRRRLPSSTDSIDAVAVASKSAIRHVPAPLACSPRPYRVVVGHVLAAGVGPHERPRLARGR